MKKLNWKKHISSNPDILYGKPTIKGTRIPVDLVLEKLAYGSSTDELLKAYPKIKVEDIYACLLFAAESVKTELTFKAA